MSEEQSRFLLLAEVRKKFSEKYPAAASQKIIFIAPKDREHFSHLFMRELMEAEEPVDALQSDGITQTVLANTTEPMELDLYVTDAESVKLFFEKRMFSATTLANFSRKENYEFEF